MLYSDNNYYLTKTCLNKRDISVKKLKKKQIKSLKNTTKSNLKMIDKKICTNKESKKNI